MTLTVTVTTMKIRNNNIVELEFIEADHINEILAFNLRR